ncbi:RCC1 domain-containing protein 1-like isoform X2 [Melanotaenia boesemani]|uniref:RCC1 domain-containing protein 1-like isoform X2 n=1 Tax=Melanotaenia boesemani TaxID=1250792 RepID=UPI001C050A7C|nr:RCC1 domain-containing protein 1-like isoform X2 [Melanotaenia boesemani]
MRWFGFGFNAFGQICSHEKFDKGDAVKELKVSTPTDLRCREDKSSCCCLKTNQVRASWSRRASLHAHGFGASVSHESCGACLIESRECKDASISESHLTLVFPDRIESWDLQEKDKTPSWSRKIINQAESSALKLPLVPGGYIASKPPFFHCLSPHLQVKSLALGGEHAVLLTVTGTVYTWGQGSHGQLGHEGLVSEEEPRTVEALWGVPISSVAAGSWHSVCISDGGDLYVWGWNESGQLGLPSRGLRKASEQKPGQQAGELCQDADTSGTTEKHEEVFIAIQAFPALLDVTPSCDFRTVSCGSRHTAAVTTKGDLYTWGWGEYGQLGHQTLKSSDEPQCVEFFKTGQMHVVDVVCGPWNTFTAVVKDEVTINLPLKPPDEH